MEKGILMHISSLPSPYGIGSLGAEAFEFVDFLKKSGQTLWQILPQNPTGFGDSPYQSVSVFAGNPYFIDIDVLKKEGLLTAGECNNYFFGEDPSRVDYERLFFYRFPLLRSAYFRFSPGEDYENFLKENSFWLDDYALFMALKEQNHYQSRQNFEEKIKRRDKAVLSELREKLQGTIDFYKFVQFKFFEQWGNLKKYANKNGIKIIGDMPIYVADDSADLWAHARLFEADEKSDPLTLACSPCKKNGSRELWGNPLYNWDEMKKDGYRWWCERLSLSQRMYDLLRIDHFHTFFEYYSLDKHICDIQKAKRRKAPGKELFEVVLSGATPKIIAENQGKSVAAAEVVSRYRFITAKVLPMPDGFEQKGISSNSIVYSSTHDTDTLCGRIAKLSEREIGKLRKKLGSGDLSESLIRSVLNCGAEFAIIPIQDYLKLGSEARMNTPSTVGGNWLFRVKKEELTDELAEYIAFAARSALCKQNRSVAPI